MKNLAVLKLTLALAIGACIPSFSAAQSLANDPLDRIVAVVEDGVVLQSELDQAIGNVLKQYEKQQDQLPPRDVLQKQVLERLVLNRLQLDRAESTGVKVSDDEIDSALTRVAGQNNMSVPQLREALNQDGISFNEFRTGISDELMIQKLRDRVMQSRSEVSESEVDIALASNQLKTGEIRLGHILVSVPEGATSEQMEKAKSKIDGVKKLIDEGKMEFSAAAIR
jgi:peptidyl-prolyl cis-trans isomerase SurA